MPTIRTVIEAFATNPFISAKYIINNRLFFCHICNITRVLLFVKFFLIYSDKSNNNSIGHVISAGFWVSMSCHFNYKLIRVFICYPFNNFFLCVFAFFLSSLPLLSTSTDIDVDDVFLFVKVEFFFAYYVSSSQALAPRRSQQMPTKEAAAINKSCPKGRSRNATIPKKYPGRQSFTNKSRI